MNTRKIIVYGLLAVLLALTGCETGIEDITKSSLTGNVTLNNNSPKVGESITATYAPGNGAGAQTWQWFRVGTGTEDLIQNATTNTYTATTADEGKKIKVQLSFADRSGSLSAITTNTVTAAANNDITYTATQTGGADGTTDSTGIVFTFSASVDSLDLSAADITVSGAAEKDASAALTGTGTSLTLTPITVSAAGLATVAIAKEGIEAVQKSVTIYKAGAYVPEYWNIIWHLNGGAEGTGAYPTQIEKGTVLDKPSPDPSKAGNTFGGWYSDSGMAQPYIFANPVTTNLNLYAKWVTDPTNTPSGTSRDDAIPLTENQWADGSLPTSDDYQWFTFTATASEQYIHYEPGTLTRLYVQVYTSSGATVGDETNFYSYSTNTSIPLTEGQTYYIMVRKSSDNSGTYRIGFNTTPYPPGTTFNTLTENIFANGNIIEANGQQWFSFTATASEQYIHAAFGTISNLYVQVYDSSGEAVGGTSYLHSSNTNTSRTLTDGQTYYIMVRTSSDNSGTYRIGFNTSTNAPFDQWPPDAAITLTENIFADGNLPTAGDVQWFVFTATASEQYIYVSFGTLTDLYVQVYDSSGATVGSETNLYDSTTRTSRSLIPGQTYYIRIRPSGSYSETYRIGFTTSYDAPFDQWPPDAASPLTANQWADGSLPTSDDQQWFVFTATASTQYIHAVPGTLTYLYVQVYDSSGATVGSGTTLYSSTTCTSRSLTVGQTYYIRVRPSGSGTYRIGFTTSIVPPGNNDPIPLTENIWADGSIPTSSDYQWFVFTSTASTQWIHFSTTGTLKDVYVRVYDSSGATVGSETNLYNSSYTSTTRTSRSLTEGQTYYIRVRPYSSSGSGTYRIGFTTTIFPPEFTLIPLTENQWADGNIPTLNGEQWFTFTATASTQWIHVAVGTLTYLYLQVYDSSGTTVGSEATVSSSTASTSAPRSLTEGDTYYIRVRPYLDSGRGTYRIAFTATPYPPGTTLNTLTENQWANGSLSTNGQQWFTFIATASPQYIHAAFGTLPAATGVRIQVYDSSNTEAGIYAYLSSSSTYNSRTLTEGQTYYIRVWPSNSTVSGTYRIAFNASTTAPQ